MPAVLTERGEAERLAVSKGAYAVSRGLRPRSLSTRDHWRRQSAIRHTLTTPLGQK